MNENKPENIENSENSKKKALIMKIIPFALTALIIILDQITKSIIVDKIPLGTIGAQLMPLYKTLADGSKVVSDYFLRIIHVANTGVAFSVGASWSATARNFLFCAIPLIVIILVIVVYFRNKDFTKIQRWAIAGVIGGGLGNIIDRFFRKEGVVDFIDFKWFGADNSPLKLFKMERWPTFNVADSAVVICGILLLVSFIVTLAKKPEDKKSENEKS